MYLNYSAMKLIEKFFTGKSLLILKLFKNLSKFLQHSSTSRTQAPPVSRNLKFEELSTVDKFTSFIQTFMTEKIAGNEFNRLLIMGIEHIKLPNAGLIYLLCPLNIPSLTGRSPLFFCISSVFLVS